MQRLITSRKTGEFFNRGKWTSNATEAQDFPDPGAALEACSEYELRGVELVFQFDSQGYFLRIPLSDL